MSIISSQEHSLKATTTDKDNNDLWTGGNAGSIENSISTFESTKTGGLPLGASKAHPLGRYQHPVIRSTNHHNPLTENSI